MAGLFSYSLDLARCWLFMFSADFGKSGGSDQIATVVEGYLATVAQWERFDVDWKLLLAKEGLPYFHMKEFVACRGAFKTGWDNEPPRARILSQLCEIIAANVKHSFSWIVVNTAFWQAEREHELSFHVGNEYSFCGRGCAAKI